MPQPRTSTLARERRRRAASVLIADDDVYGVKIRRKRGLIVFEWTLHRDPLVAAAQTTGVHDLLAEVESTLVHQMRASGLSWSDVGGVLGVTRQTAQQRFGSVDADLRSELAEYING